MTKVRNKENEDLDYIYSINIQLIGKPRLEEAITKYLGETIEQYFLERGEKFKTLDIVNITQNRS